MKKSEFLKEIRKKYKMSRPKFAELLNVSASSIEKIEREQIPITPENKYVKAVCALEGLDNEIFKYDEITDEILEKYELTKFSKAFRKFLYFYYGDFWNEEINSILLENIKAVLLKYVDILDQNNLAISIYTKFRNLEKYITAHLADNNLKNKYCEEFIRLLLILSIVQQYNFLVNIREFEDYPHQYIKLLQTYGDKILDNCFEDVFFSTLKKKTIINFLSEMEEGLPLTIENIKKLKKQKELEKISDEIVPASTDPKDKQICELLKYAPPAFKDKIIEKLLKFKDEVEDI
jgi:transcriptional regulator with XRE-family HTH domain